MRTSLQLGVGKPLGYFAFGALVASAFAEGLSYNLAKGLSLFGLRLRKTL